MIFYLLEDIKPFMGKKWNRQLSQIQKDIDLETDLEKRGLLLLKRFELTEVIFKQGYLTKDNKLIVLISQNVARDNNIQLPAFMVL